MAIERQLEIEKQLELEDYTTHGLRYNAASELTEAGCSDQEIVTNTGHKSLSIGARIFQGDQSKKISSLCNL